MRLAPDDPRHGTVNGYNNHGCRCDRCRRATADARRDKTHRLHGVRPREVYLADIRANIVPHGTETRYVGHRCRCDECKRASRDARAARRQRAAA